ncbi:molybdopterin converting factor subunit 1 [bacterium]|nr:MAG: molybdopterin converting factor subunit 1 [bacterium]
MISQPPAECGTPYNRNVPTVDVRYFALFRERAGRDEERIETSAATVDALYAELQPRLGLDPQMVRAAVNGEFVENDQPLKDGDEVVFVPPVAGG